MTSGAVELPLRVSTLEIFFDLIFAFTLTQLTSLLASELSWAAVGPGPPRVRLAVVDVRRLRLAD